MVSIVGLNLLLCLFVFQLDIVTSDFTCGADGFYANPDLCMKFINCAKGRRYDFDCPLGTSFHADKGICDTADLNKCATKATPVPRAVDPGTSTDLEQRLLAILKDFKACRGGKHHHGSSEESRETSEESPCKSRRHRHRNPATTEKPTTTERPNDHLPETTSRPVTCPACPAEKICPTVAVCPTQKPLTCPTAPPCPTTIPTQAACPDGWKYYVPTRSCYFVGKQQITYNDAQDLCQKQGANLASIHSADENTFIIDYALSVSTQDSTIWIGLNRTGPTPDDFHNLDGTPYDYKNWASAQPDNGYTEGCVEMMPSWQTIINWPNATWNDYNCNDVARNPRLYVCKKAAITTSNPTTCSTPAACPAAPTCPPPQQCPTCPVATERPCPTAVPCPAAPTCPPPTVCPTVTEKVCPSPPPCPATPQLPTTITLPKRYCDPGWQYYEGSKSCYRLGKDQAAVYDDAQAQCVKQGANLTSIHSAGENAFIGDYIYSMTLTTQPSYTWIGVFRTGPTAADFVNLDKTPLDYTNWAPGNPSNTRGNEYCTEYIMADPQWVPRSWNDRVCSGSDRVGVSTVYYMCKKAAKM